MLTRSASIQTPSTRFNSAAFDVGEPAVESRELRPLLRKGSRLSHSIRRSGRPFTSLPPRGSPEAPREVHMAAEIQRSGATSLRFCPPLLPLLPLAQRASLERHRCLGPVLGYSDCEDVREFSTALVSLHSAAAQGPRCSTSNASEEAVESGSLLIAISCK
jgi:hypothetical protein